MRARTKLRGGRDGPGSDTAMDMRGKGTLSRGIEIMKVLRDAEKPLSVAEIGEFCEFDPSTTHRVLQILLEEGLVLKDEATKRYITGPGAFAPLSLYHPISEFRRDAEPQLLLLRDTLGYTTGVALFCFRERVLLDLAQGRDPWYPYYETWLRSPVHGSASGKLLLASLNPDDRRQLLGDEPYPACTEKTITSEKSLLAELALIEERGYASADGDAFSGRSAVAAPIRTSRDDVVGCFVVAGKSTDFSPERIQATGVELKRAAESFSKSTPSVDAVAKCLGFSIWRRQ